MSRKPKLSPQEIAEIEARIAADSGAEPDLTDPENPEWTKEDFARAMGPEDLPPEVLAAFPRTRARVGRPKAETPKETVSIRLKREILDHLRASGKGWQTRAEAELERAIRDGRL